METSRINLTRQQSVVLAIVAVVVSLGVVWLMVSIIGDDASPTSTTAASAPPPTEATTTAIEMTTTSEPVTTATVGVFDEVDAVESFIADFASAIEDGDSEFLFERLHPAVKATYEDEACRTHIDDQVLPVEGYRQMGPIVGPFDSVFGEFPITSYEARVAFEIEGETMETTAVFSLTEGIVRWLIECS